MILHKGTIHLIGRAFLYFAIASFLTPTCLSQNPTAVATSGGSSQPGASNATPVTMEVVVVTGTFEPLPLSEANRSVTMLDTQEQPLLYNSVIDYLKTDPSVDIEQRSPDGVQADLSIRGANFAQSLVLLNGLRINDAQSGHHDMDIPVPLDSLARVEVLHGAGSTLYGADAMGGAVNFITQAPTYTEVRALAGIGNFGFNQQRLELSYVGHGFSELLAGSRDFSSGFISDRDYRSSTTSSETRFQTALGKTDVLIAGSDRPFGANTFYGDFPSWERTKGWYGSVTQAIDDQTTLSFGYRRHSDEFVLVRDDPSLYENNHIGQSWQAALRRSNVWHTFVLSYGLDADGDQIDSNNLGHHARNREAGYFNADVERFRHLFLSLGAREEGFSGGRTEFAPALAAALRLAKGLRLRGNVSRGFRLPTYTDLYYSDPANLGNPLLKPESAWNFEAGPEWDAAKRISLAATVFDRSERNDIDYVRTSPNAPWRATNITSINFVGAETSVRARLPYSQELLLAYTLLTSNQQLPAGTTSKYVFNYPLHNAVFTWLGQYKNFVAVRTRVGVTQRVGQDAYALWDLSAARARGWVRPYLEFSNLANTSYQEVPGVVMPGRSVIGGVEFVWTSERNRKAKTANSM